MVQSTMADPLSIVSGITALVTLSATVLAAGYRYVNSISSAPEEFKGLIRETASLSSILSQLISHSLSKETLQQINSYTLIQQDILQDCEETLRNVQSLIHDCELFGRRNRKNAINSLLWPLKKREIVKNHERLGRLCANLHIVVSTESASTLRILESEQKLGNEVIRGLAQNADETQERKILDWLSSLDHTVKHTTTMLLKQPGTYEWFLKEKTVLAWLNHGELLWLQGASGTGKTVLMYRNSPETIIFAQS